MTENKTILRLVVYKDHNISEFILFFGKCNTNKIRVRIKFLIWIHTWINKIKIISELADRSVCGGFLYSFSFYPVPWVTL